MKRAERKACSTALDPEGCRASVERRLKAQVETCSAARTSCRRCCRGQSDAGACIAPRAVEFCTTDADCDDGNVCTDDACDGTLGCLHAPLSAACDDGVACTAGDACANGVCVGGSPAPGCTPCAAAAAIPAQGGTFLGATSGTGTLAGSCGDSAAAPERVYAWTPEKSGAATISTCGSGTGYDTIVYLRTGSCDAGAEAACNDDTPGCAVNDGTTGADHHGSTVSTTVTAGVAYFIVVDGFEGKGGSYALTVVPPSVCGDGVREGAEQCDGTDRAACASGACAADCTCVPPAGGLPDLVPEISDVSLQRGATVPAGDVAEGCAAATSGIDLLRFAATTRNVGTANLEVGDPMCPVCASHPLEVCGNPEFVCSPAGGHGHGHYTNYARYELLDGTGRVTVVGHKQGFCLRDNICASPFYTCDFQGISAGCADVYGADLGCQYLDVTGVPDGNYTLRVTVDPFGRIPELDETNNVAALAVTLGAGDTCPGVTDVPADGGTLTGTTSGASAQSGSCAAQSALAPEQVFRWTPAVSGTATASTCGAGTAFDTVLYVRQGSCTGTEVACNDDTDACATGDGCATADHHGSSASFDVVAGTEYFIVVDGFSGSCGGSEGAFTLTIVPPAGGGVTTTTTLAPTTTIPGATTSTTLVPTTTSTAPPSASTTTSSTTTTSVTTTTVFGNHAPDCEHALAVPPLLWPPDHTFVDVGIVGVFDVDLDRVTITVLGVRQDEAVSSGDDGGDDGDGDEGMKPPKDDGRGDKKPGDDDKKPGDDKGPGDDHSEASCPDATGIGTHVAKIRAERDGSGDGRVYHIAFQADDGRGGSCTGTVRVCVPHDRGHDGPCGDGGSLFDSTGPCDASPKPGPKPKPDDSGPGEPPPPTAACAGLTGLDRLRCVCAEAVAAGCLEDGLSKGAAHRLARACRAVAASKGGPDGPDPRFVRRAEEQLARVGRSGGPRASAACRSLLGLIPQGKRRR